MGIKVEYYLFSNVKLYARIKNFKYWVKRKPDSTLNRKKFRKIIDMYIIIFYIFIATPKSVLLSSPLTIKRQIMNKGKLRIVQEFERKNFLKQEWFDL